MADSNKKESPPPTPLLGGGGGVLSAPLRRLSDLMHVAVAHALLGAATDTTAAHITRRAEDKKQWMKIGNLLHGFESPSLMDIKMGQRTYLHNKKVRDLRAHRACLCAVCVQYV